MRRRHLLGAAGAAALTRPGLAQAQDGRVLRFVPIADLGVLDPIVTTTYITRNHGYLVWDTLYGLDASVRPRPQMAEGHSVEEDGRRVLLRLRPGLRFHDGEPVLARDCVASIRRWGARDSLGQTLLALTDSLEAPDDRTVLFRLRRPFPLLFDALAKTSPPVCFVMPERLARTDPAQAIREAVGSGPFRFLADERVAGARVAYARFEGYAPREEGEPSGTAGPKRARFERVEWRTIPDPATAAAALQAGEADWWEFPTPDLLPLLRRHRDLVVENPDPFGFMGALRFNHLHPPFNDPAARRALLPAVAQADYMAAVAGADRSAWRDGVGFFPPGAPMATDAGMEALAGPRDSGAARRALAAAGHGGAKATLIGPTDYPNVQALTEVGADMLRRVGLDLDYAASDWATVVGRRGNREPPARRLERAVHLLLGPRFPAPGRAHPPALQRPRRLVRLAGVGRTGGVAGGVAGSGGPGRAAPLGRRSAAPRLRRSALRAARPVLPAHGLPALAVRDAEGRHGVLERPARRVTAPRPRR